MALLGKSKTLSKLFNQGPIGDMTEGLGIGGLINFADSRTGGHLKGIGVPLGRTINGQPLSLNLTDAVMALATTGIHFGGNSMIRFVITLVSKKAGEAFGIIMDDPLPMGDDIPERTTWPELGKEPNYQPKSQIQIPESYVTASAFGGLNN